MAGIYIHIPFCKKRCLYCDFYSCTDLSRKELVLDNIVRELGNERGFVGEEQVTSIYIGGGTPSLYAPAQIQAVIERIKSLWYCCGNIEITMEANPDDMTTEYIMELSQTDVNRLSIGVQSFIDRDLSFMGRRHTSQQSISAVSDAQKAGFDNITIDLIYGIPGMTLKEWEDNLHKAIDLGVQHISAYHLTFEQGTPLWKRLKAGEIQQVSEDESETQYMTLHGTLTANGFEHYELSNFARRGRRAVHNSSYWNGSSYLGVGPSAHSYNGRQRRICTPSVDRYVSEMGNRDIYQTEDLTIDEMYNEFIMTALRCADGVDIVHLRARFGQTRGDEFEKIAKKHIQYGTMSASSDRYYIPLSRMLVSDAVISDFFIS